MSKGYELAEGEDLITKFEFLRYVPGIIVVKDTNTAYQNMSRRITNLYGWNHVNEAIGKTAYDIPSAASKAAELYTRVDKSVIESKQAITSIEACNYNEGVILLFVEKKPLINSQGIVIGLLGHAIDITGFILKSYQWLDQTDTKFISKLDLPKQYILTSEFSPLLLSARQQECLSLLIRGKTMKEIAFMLGISIRTVETHFESIKHKLSCYNKSQLIEKAIDSGFLFHIPESLFGLNLFK